MSAHTPGPWGMIAAKSVGARDFGIKADGCANILAEVFEEFHGAGVFAAPEAEANARLIAAAPELLEALEEVLDGAAEPHADHCNSTAGCTCDVKTARAAIAKARGES